MKPKTVLFAVLMVVLALGLVSGSALGEDGVIFRRNISRTPDGITGESSIGMMNFYVPAQKADGTLTTIEYTVLLSDTETVIETRDYARPLLTAYNDGIEHNDLRTGAGFGDRDAYAALSLDDGATWKNYNLSDSAHLSSFTVDGIPYPGDVFYLELAVSREFANTGRYAMVAWISRYCDGGLPAYTIYPDKDLFGVAGAQKSVDYTLQGFPEVGEVPYGCVWAARGTLEQITRADGTTYYDMIWRKAERLTSGRRDAHRLEVKGTEGAGFIITWQEDPEGLRPGQGLGPGEGWSGAIVNSKTDVWYSYISWDDFALVDDPTTENLENIPDPIEYVYDPEGTLPKVGVLMKIPVRLTDNDFCDATSLTEDPYCKHDFDDDGIAEFCANTVVWTNPGGQPKNVCVTEDGRTLVGRVGASRPRIGLMPYTTYDYDTIVDVITTTEVLTDTSGITYTVEITEPVYDTRTSAWVLLSYEESKALGDGISEEDVEPIDIGKNIWYHSFDMFEPDLVSHGHILNQPAADPATGLFFDMQVDDWGNAFYETEIARRSSMVIQSGKAALNSIAKTSALVLFKQGIINQGGPADIYMRRFVIPEVFDPKLDNPYAFENIDCAIWDYVPITDTRYTTETVHADINPNYPGGICLSTPTNLSATSIKRCENLPLGGDPTKPADCVAAFPWDFGVSPFPKITIWEQTVDNLDDQTWENPYDIAKGHRGFLDGDFLMVMYAWSPNWMANSVGNDKYNLYIRRSFDGGQTWTTTPLGLGDDIGPCHTENYLEIPDGQTELSVETCYGVGAFEPARNVSQMLSTKITVLDPRYIPTAPAIFSDTLKTVYRYPDDARDPSKFLVVYETGDNTVVSEDSSAVPLDLYYSRASDWGDNYDDIVLADKPDNNGVYRESFDWLENQQDDLSGEAALVANPGGNFFYAVWNQWNEFEEDVVTNSDMWYRRLYYNEILNLVPVARIVVAPSVIELSTTEEVYFQGFAKDYDQCSGGIVDYEWTSSVDGLMSNQPGFAMNPKQWGLTPGMHIIKFRVQDASGKWSIEAIQPLLVSDTVFRVYLPFTR